MVINYSDCRSNNLTSNLSNYCFHHYAISVTGNEMLMLIIISYSIGAVLFLSAQPGTVTTYVGYRDVLRSRLALVYLCVCEGN